MIALYTIPNDISSIFDRRVFTLVDKFYITPDQCLYIGNFLDATIARLYAKPLSPFGHFPPKGTVFSSNALLASRCPLWGKMSAKYEQTKGLNYPLVTNHYPLTTS